MPEDEPMHVDTSPPSEVEVIREMSFMKRHEAAGADWLSVLQGRNFSIRVNKTPEVNLGERYTVQNCCASR